MKKQKDVSFTSTYVRCLITVGMLCVGLILLGNDLFQKKVVDEHILGYMGNIVGAGLGMTGVILTILFTMENQKIYKRIKIRNVEKNILSNIV